MTEKRYALAHDYPLQVPAGTAVEAAIAEVFERHRDELEEALRPLGVALDDLLLPTWMRAVYVDDVEAFGGYPDRSEACSPDACDETCSMRRADAAGEAAPVGVQILDIHDSISIPRLEGDGSGILSGDLVVDGEVHFEDRPVIAPGILAKAAQASVGRFTPSPVDPDSAARAVADIKRRLGDHGDPEEGAHVDVPVSPSEALAAQLNAAALAGGGSVEVGRCCGAGEACSSPTCSGTPAPGGTEDVAPSRLEDAKVDLLGALRRSVDRARAFQAEADANGYGRPVAKAEPNNE